MDYNVIVSLCHYSIALLNVVIVKTPMAPSGLRVTSVTHDNISLAWDASQSKVVHYIIVMRETSKKKFRKVAKVDGSELTCSLTTGFEQNQDYIFRVYAENEVIEISRLLHTDCS